MMTLDNLISVLCLCLTSVALGYALGQIHAKKITAQSAKQAVIFYT